MGPALKLAICASLCGLLALGGCAYTTVQPEIKPPALGPAVKTGKQAVMPMVVDRRSWPNAESKKPIANVRIFRRDISSRLKQGLLDRGLFTALPSPQQAAGEVLRNKFNVSVLALKLSQTGTNAWIVAHLLLDGAVLPVFTVAALGTKGEVDLGGYLIPSTEMSTLLNANAVWKDVDIKKPVLSRTYSVKVPLGSVSERRLIQELGNAQNHGVMVGKEQGYKAIDLLAETMSRDPHWSYLDQYRTLAVAQSMSSGYNRSVKQFRKTWLFYLKKYTAQAESLLKKKRKIPTRKPAAKAKKMEEDKKPEVFEAWSIGRSKRPPSLAEMAAMGEKLVAIMPIPKYSNEEASVLRDGYLKTKKSAKKRAKLVNSIRALQMGLEGPEDMPAQFMVKPDDLDRLYDDPEVERSLVEEGMVKTIMPWVFSVLLPSEGPKELKKKFIKKVDPTPKALAYGLAMAGRFPAGQKTVDGQIWYPSPRGTLGIMAPVTFPEPDNAAELRQTLRSQLVKKLRQSIRLQALFLPVADKAVKKAWPPMEQILIEVDTPLTRDYLEKRGAKQKEEGEPEEKKSDS